MILTNGQESGLKIAVARYRNKEPYTCIAGYAGTGKAQPVDTLIPTPTGYKLLGDIKIGDYVFDRMGKPTKVLGVYPQGMLDCYKVELSDGRITYCNDQHIWSCYDRRKHRRSKFVNRTLNEMITNGLFYKNPNRNSNIYKYIIPVAKCAEFEEKYYEIDPYVIGVFLGDGCCKQRQLTLSSKDEDMVQEVSRLLNCVSYHKQSGSNYNWTFSTVPYTGSNGRQISKIQTQEIFKKFPEVCCEAYKKDIPRIYMFGSKEQRLSLIQGLMDTDGCITRSKGRYHVTYSSTSINLIKSIQQVLMSLGYISTIAEDRRVDKYTTGLAYELIINIPNREKHKLFRLSRKKNIALEVKRKSQHKDYSVVSIVNVEKCPDQKEMVCIYVDNNEHLYLTNDYIVTHNTTLVNHIIDALRLDQKDVCYAAFTGKASLVLREKGCENSMTMHRLLYHSKELPDGAFEHKPKDRLEHPYKLIVVDEVSMVPIDMWNLLLTHGVHVIALGDPFQLPPIDGESEILSHPHVFLDEIVRQAQDSEIIRLTMNIRAGLPLVNCKGNEVSVISKHKLNDAYYSGADQIIAAKNITRANINWKCRKIKFGEDVPDYPLKGEKVICLKNYWDRVSNQGDPLINGMIGCLNNINYRDSVLFEKLFDKEMTSDFCIEGSNQFRDVFMDYKLFTEGKQTINSENWQKYRGVPKPRLFDYAYCITCHKSQGSEFDKVLVFDEYMKGTDHARWLYTAATRAKKKLIIVSD